MHDGVSYTLPLPVGEGTGLGKPLKLVNHPVRDDIPIYLASLGPKNVALTAEAADGWLPAFFHPDRADSVWGESCGGRSETADVTRPARDLCWWCTVHHRRRRNGPQAP